jgi:hypothetical protein
MSEILTIALHAEGTTDYKFFKPIIRRTIEDIILNSECDIEIYPIMDIFKETGNTYCDEIINASKKAFDAGMKCLILHCDADNSTIDDVMQNKISPACTTINNHQDKDIMCDKLIPLIPIYMTEAWMLADIELLKSEICASKFSNSELGFIRKAQNYADPKHVIKMAISTAQQKTTKHRRTFDISELYSPLGQKIDLNLLKNLTSYQKFYNELKTIALPYC